MTPSRKTFNLRPSLVTAGCLSMLASVTALAQQLPAATLPTGPQVVGGSATVTRSGPALQVVTGGSRTAIDWRSFSIGSQASVWFQQPNASAVTLNRVTGTDASQIFGSLGSNGQLILANPYGVWFGAGARVDAAAVTAVAGRIGDGDVARFIGGGGTTAWLTGLVRNDGTITATDLGSVALLGAGVDNAGAIRARSGRVTLASGDKATLDFSGDGLMHIAVGGVSGSGVSSTGSIYAPGGQVQLTASQARVLIDGLVDVSADQATQVFTNNGVVTLKGGNIDVSGADVTIASAAELRADGANGGGRIRIGGDLMGRTVEADPIVHASTVDVANGATLSADATVDGNGGKIVVWSDHATGFDGSASTRGAGLGAGGLIETSSSGVLKVGADAQITTYAPGGVWGLWLLDPASLTVVASGGTGTIVGGQNDEMSTINASTIVAALATSKVLLLADDQITVNAPIVTTTLGGSPSGLEIIAQGANGTVDINAPILLEGGNLAIRAVRNINLGTAAPTETDFTKRAIIDVGSGTLWLETGLDGAIAQATNSAVIAAKLGVVAGSVNLTSFDNYAGTLAGVSSNGVFNFNQSNATGTTNLGTVTDPFTPASVTGVQQTVLVFIGQMDHVASNASGNDIQTLTVGGHTFDTLRFTALPYAPIAGGPTTPPATGDSSDYLVRAVSFTLSNGSPGTYTVTPETAATSRPAAFGVSAENGLLIIASDGFVNYWGVQGFTALGLTNRNEINYDPATKASEGAIFKLGGDTNAVTATFAVFFSPDGMIPFAEALRTTFYDSVTGPGTLNARMQSLTATGNPATRVYGDPNPAIAATLGPFSGVDAFVASQLGASRITPTVTATTAATTASSVGNYPITPTVTGNAFFNGRYAVATGPAALTITPAPLSVNASSETRQYGNADPALAFTVAGLRNGDSPGAVLTGGLSRQTGENVGSYGITLGSLASNPNYAIVFAPNALVITPAPLVIAANPGTKVYGDGDPALTYAVTGLQNGDTAGAVVTGTPGRQPGENVGAYAIGLGSVAANANYAVSFVSSTFNITPAPLLVMALPETKLIGTPDPALAFQATGLKNGDTAGALTGALARMPGESVGEYAINQGTVSGSNYAIRYQPSFLDIVAAPPLLDTPPSIIVMSAPIVTPLATPVLDQLGPPAGNKLCDPLETPPGNSLNQTGQRTFTEQFHAALACRPRAFVVRASRAPSGDEVGARDSVHDYTRAYLDAAGLGGRAAGATSEVPR